MHTTAMQINDKNIDICLISPPSRASGITVPIALLYLDSWLTRENIKSKIIDIKYGKPNSHLTPNQIKTVQQKIVKSIVDINPKVVGITCYSTEFWEVIELAQAIRQRIQSQIIVGGVHANIKPEDFFFNGSPINIVVSGDGQEPLVEVITKINSDQDFNGIKGVNYLDKNKEIILQGTASFSRLNELPNPDYSQLDMSYYTQPNPYIIRSLLASGIHIFTTIGCPFLCTFCCNRNRTVKFRPIENVLDEIEHLKINYSIDSFYIQDDTFCLKKSRVREFVNGIQERKLELFWGMETRVNLVDAEILKLIKDSGCIQIDFGVESGSDAALKRMKKGTTNSDTIKAFALCKKHKIRTYANIMFNTPGETTEDVEMTINLLKAIRPTRIGLGLTVPFPGSEVYNQHINPPLTKEDYKLFKQPNLFFTIIDPRFKLAKHDINLSRLRIKTKIRISGIRALFDFTSNCVYWEGLWHSKRKKQYITVFITAFFFERITKVLHIFLGWFKWK